MPKTRRPTTRAERRAKRPATLPDRFEPRFLAHADKRQGVIREIIRRLDRLTEDAGADSYQKELLCRRAVFISVQLESMETAAAEDGRIDLGVYTQSVNCLLGLLKSLSLERKAKSVPSLRSYVGGSRR